MNYNTELLKVQEQIKALKEKEKMLKKMAKAEKALEEESK